MGASSCFIVDTPGFASEARLVSLAHQAQLEDLHHIDGLETMCLGQVESHGGLARANSTSNTDDHPNFIISNT